MVLYDCAVSQNIGGNGSDVGEGGTILGGAPGRPGGAGGDGGGIYNLGELRLNFCTVSDNRSGDGGRGTHGFGGTGGSGGSGGGGAGLFNVGGLSLNTCTISGNTCGSGGMGGEGGGDYCGSGFGGAGGQGGNGGGIHNAGALSFISCTSVSNLAGLGGNSGNSEDAFSGATGGGGGRGGGLCSAGNGSFFPVHNSLVALNSAGGGGFGGTNSDYQCNFEPDPVIVVSIGSLGPAGLGPDLAGNFTSEGFNLVGKSDGSTGFSNEVKADLVGRFGVPIDPLIGPLQMNGGPTLTHALLPGSPAIDQGKSFGIHRDQRGRHRPINERFIPNSPTLAKLVTDRVKDGSSFEHRPFVLKPVSQSIFQLLHAVGQDRLRISNEQSKLAKPPLLQLEVCLYFKGHIMQY